MRVVIHVYMYHDLRGEAPFRVVRDNAVTIALGSMSQDGFDPFAAVPTPVSWIMLWVVAVVVLDDYILIDVGRRERLGGFQQIFDLLRCERLDEALATVCRLSGGQIEAANLWDEMGLFGWHLFEVLDGVQGPEMGELFQSCGPVETLVITGLGFIHVLGGRLLVWWWSSVSRTSRLLASAGRGLVGGLVGHDAWIV